MTLKKIIWYIIGFLISSIIIFYLINKEEKEIISEIKEDISIQKYVKAHIDLTNSKVPNGPEKGVAKRELYKLAWQQFIALNWPVADPNIKGNRGKPSSNISKSFLRVPPNDPPVLVWNTYASKAEMFGPAYQYTLPLPAWDSLSLPVYSYEVSLKPKNRNSFFTLFNNLDENNEIGEAFVYGGAGLGKTTGGSQVLYEAKVNKTEYSYIRKHNLQNANIAKKWAHNTVENINEFGGTCLTSEAANKAVICFPCADSENSKEGVIEIKAAWRKLTNIDNKDHYYNKEVIIYQKNKHGETEYINETYALIGLHIIRKTKNYPTFIFTTFNHVDNIENGIYYKNNINKKNPPPHYQYYKNKKPDTLYDPNHKYIQQGNIAVKSQKEIHEIPQELKDFNAAVQNKIKKGNSQSIWQYYELVGVQAVPIDLANADSDPSYYLANDVIETDYTLRKFTGSFGNPTGIELGTQNINQKGQTVSMGGCMGCHGNAQKSGKDFSFLLGGILKAPDTIKISNMTPEKMEAIIEFVK